MSAVLGWKCRTRERLDVHKCPACHVNRIEIGGNEDEYVLVRLLCRSAKSEESFRCHAEKGDSLVLVCTDGRRYIGYLDSSVDADGTPLLHQIFIADDHRKRGLGTELLKYWAETYV